MKSTLVFIAVFCFNSIYTKPTVKNEMTDEVEMTTKMLMVMKDEATTTGLSDEQIAKKIKSRVEEISKKLKEKYHKIDADDEDGDEDDDIFYDDEDDEKIDDSREDKKRVRKHNDLEDEADMNEFSDDGEDDLEDYAEESESEPDDPIVDTSKGVVEGIKLTEYGTKKPVYAFLGIPYANPPIGEHQFQAPMILNPWYSIYQAIYWPPNCNQVQAPNLKKPFTMISHQMSQDCLQLNVWTPSLDRKKSLPVMIWIHGGLFSKGSGATEETDGGTLAAFGDIIVVTFNYRLGSYGFLNLNTNGAPGNMGLLDQRAAISWVSSNIKEFGGNPNEITLFGSGSGAVSAGIHIMNPVTGLFIKRAILQSGSPIHPRYDYSKSSEIAERFADYLGCNEEDEDGNSLVETDPESVIVCINRQPSRSIMEATEGIFFEDKFGFHPATDSPYLRKHPIDSNKHDYLDKEIMTGFNEDDGSLSIYYSIPDNFTDDGMPPTIVNKKMANVLLLKLAANDWWLPKIVRKKVMKAFMDDEGIEQENFIKEIGSIFGDNKIACPVFNFASRYADAGRNVYVYKFNHQSSTSPFGEWAGAHLHSEIPFVFGHPLREPSKYTKEEIELSKRIMTTWTKFAKTGKALNQMDKEWPKYTKEEPNIIEITLKKAEVIEKTNKCDAFDEGIAEEEAMVEKEKEEEFFSVDYDKEEESTESS